MSKKISVGIDVGSYQIKVAAATAVKENGKTSPKIIGVGYAESRGLRRGHILNQEETVKSLRNAIKQSEKASGIKIQKAFVSVGGAGLAGYISTGAVVISRADLEITDLDIKKAVTASQSAIPPSFALNRKIIHTVPIHYKIDGKPIYGKPLGMKGAKLEVKTLFITTLERQLEDLVETLGEAGIEVEDIVAAPIAASLVTVSKAQKIAGCVLANVGSETVSIVVFENNGPISIEVFPLGSTDITNDIALGLRIPLEEAEDLKRGNIIGVTYPKKKLDEIISARLSDIFELIEAHLKKIGRSGLLPAGIILTGGGSSVEMISELAKTSLRLPSRIASVNFGENTKGEIRNASWSVAFGLCVLGLNDENEELSGIKLARQAKNDILGWLKQFLP